MNGYKTYGLSRTERFEGWRESIQTRNISTEYLIFLLRDAYMDKTRQLDPMLLEAMWEEINDRVLKRRGMQGRK